jgi:hypothetical protein
MTGIKVLNLSLFACGGGDTTTSVAPTIAVHPADVPVTVTIH